MPPVFSERYERLKKLEHLERTVSSEEGQRGRFCVACKKWFPLKQLKQNKPSKFGRMRKCINCFNVFRMLRSEKYRDTQNFGSNKLKVLIRDKYKCVVCGMTNLEHMKKWKRRITIDHKDGSGINSKVHNHRMSNLQTLCLTCHGKKDGVRK